MVVDFNRPESALALGGELVTAADALGARIASNPHTITDVIGLDAAVRARREIAEAIGKVEEFFESPIGLAHKLHKSLCDRRAAILAPLLALDRAQQNAIREFKAIEDRRREEEARARAEEERIRQQSRAAEEAAALERDGESEMAAAVMQEAIEAPLPVIVVPDPTAGIAKFRRRWTWKYAGGPAEVAHTPPAILERARAVMPREFLVVDEKKIGAYVRSMKASGKIPGIEIYSVEDPVR